MNSLAADAACDPSVMSMGATPGADWLKQPREKNIADGKKATVGECDEQMSSLELTVGGSGNSGTAVSAPSSKFVPHGKPQTVPRMDKVFFAPTSMHFRSLPGGDCSDVCAKANSLLQECGSMVSIKEGSGMSVTVLVFDDQMTATGMELIPYIYSDKEEHVLEVQRVSGDVDQFSALFQNLRRCLRDDPALSMMRSEEEEEHELDEIVFNDFALPVPTGLPIPIAPSIVKQATMESTQEKPSVGKPSLLVLARNPDTQAEAALMLDSTDEAFLPVVKLLLSAKHADAVLPTLLLLEKAAEAVVAGSAFAESLVQQRVFDLVLDVCYASHSSRLVARRAAELLVRHQDILRPCSRFQRRLARFQNAGGATDVAVEASLASLVA